MNLQCFNISNNFSKDILVRNTQNVIKLFEHWNLKMRKNAIF